MHAGGVDWALTAAVMGSFGSVVNAVLVIWLVLVTRRYVSINAELLMVTREAVALSGAQAALNRENLQLLKNQAAAQATERIGPVLATTSGILEHLSSWRTLVTDLHANAGVIAERDLPLFAEDARQIARITSALSLTTYRRLMRTVQSLTRLGMELGELRILTQKVRDGAELDTETAATIAQQLLALIEETSTELNVIEGELLRMIPN